MKFKNIFKQKKFLKKVTSTLITMTMIITSIGLFPKEVLADTNLVTPTVGPGYWSAKTDDSNGDWSLKQVKLVNTPEAQVMVRSGDIDNFGMGWPTNFNPFSCQQTNMPQLPWSPPCNEQWKTDTIMVPSGYKYNYKDVNHENVNVDNGTGNIDKFTELTRREDVGVDQFFLQYDQFVNNQTNEKIKVNNAVLQLYLGDFQPQSPNRKNSSELQNGNNQYTFKINNTFIPEIAEKINSLDQTGHKGQLITVEIPQKYLTEGSDVKNALEGGNVPIRIDDAHQGATGDAFAVDFIKLLINTKTTPTVQASLDISRTVNAQNLKVGDTLDVTYTITPKAIPVQQSTAEKDVVLVMDTSGSMNDNSKLSIIKNVANNFINKFNNSEKVNVSLIKFGDYAIEQVPLTNLKNGSNSLKSGISTLRASGSTNIGDGLRLAYNELNNNNGHDKYVVLMTDGVAEAYSYDGNGYIMGTENLTGDNNIRATNWYGNRARPDYRIQSLDYAKKVASEKIAKSNIGTFIVGFGNEAGNNNQQIADAAKGTYQQASDEDAVNNVYSKIQQQIASQVQGNVNFQETFNDNLEIADITKIPDGVKIDGNKLVGSFNANYTLNNDSTQYTANPISFTVKYKVKTAGDCILGQGGNSSFAKLTLSQNIDTKYLDEVKLTAEAVKTPLIDITRTTDKQSIQAGEAVTAKYTITPKDIVAKQDDTEKDIILVIDTSTSMNYIPSADREPQDSVEKSRLDIIKNVAYGFVDKFKGNSKINISLIDYNQLAKVDSTFVNMGSSDRVDAINSAIDNLETDSNTNIGDGLREAYYMLNDKNGHNKYIVLMTDGYANTYAINGNWPGGNSGDSRNWYKDGEWYKNYEGYIGYNRYYCRDGQYYWNYYMDSDIATKFACFGDNDPKGLEYANKVASEKIANSDIKSFIVGFGSGAGSNNEQIAKSANGVYEQASDENAVNNVYDEIQKKIDENIYGDVHLEETFSGNLTAQNIPDELKNNIQVSGNKIIGDFKNIEYVNDGNGNYKAKPITFNLDYIAKADGKAPYVLGSGGTTSFAKISVMGEEDTKNLNELDLSGVGNSEIQMGIFMNNEFKLMPDVSIVKGFDLNLAIKISNIKNQNISVQLPSTIKASDVRVYKADDLNNPVATGTVASDGFNVTLPNSDNYSDYIIVYKATADKSASVGNTNDTLIINGLEKGDKHNINIVPQPKVE